MRYLKVIILVLIFFFSMLFFVQNTELLSTSLTLKLDFLGKHYESQEIPIYLLILIAFVLGAFISLFYFLAEKIKLSQQLRTYRNKIANLEKEVTSLRNMPLQEESFSTESETTGS
ncbi:LapA family protein [Desulfovulcanus sp.]